MKINIEQVDTGGTLAVDLAILRPQVGPSTSHSFYTYPLPHRLGHLKRCGK